jgi:hypothetical protein
MEGEMQRSLGDLAAAGFILAVWAVTSLWLLTVAG